MKREEEIKGAAYQYELAVLDNAGIDEEKKYDNYRTGLKDAILEVTSKAFIAGAKWADENRPEDILIDYESIEEGYFAKLMQNTRENNTILKEILAYIRKVDDDEYVTKKQLHDFINNVVADLFADMLLQPKGRGHIDKEFINDIINKMK